MMILILDIKEAEYGQSSSYTAHQVESWFTMDWAGVRVDILSDIDSMGS